MFEMTIFTIDGLKEKELEEILKKTDNTFGPMSSGGYSVQKKEKGKDNSFILTELDCAPASSFRIRIKRNTIWVPYKNSGIIAGFLARSHLTFATKHQTFDSPQKARLAFSKA